MYYNYVGSMDVFLLFLMKILYDYNVWENEHIRWEKNNNDGNNIFKKPNYSKA